jgi:hypothetical protein
LVGGPTDGLVTSPHDAPGLLRINRNKLSEFWQVTVATAGQERRRDAESDQRARGPAAGMRASNGSEEALNAPSQRFCLRWGSRDWGGRGKDGTRRRDITIFLRRLRGELSGSGGEIARPLSWLHPKTVLALQIN